MSDETRVLTEDEIESINRLKSALGDMGVQGVLNAALSGSSSNPEFESQSLRVFIADVQNTDSAHMHEAGLSLWALVELANSSKVFPDDFLPTKDAVQICLDGFWASFATS